MTTIDFDALKEKPRSKVSEAVWIAVLSIAASHNAQAKQNGVEEHETLENEDKLKESKDSSSQQAMAAAGGSAGRATDNDASIVGDGEVAEHSGEEGQAVQEAELPKNTVQQQPTHDENGTPITHSDQDLNSESHVNPELSAEEVVEASDNSQNESAEEDDSDTVFDSITSVASPIIAGMDFDTGFLAILGVGAVAIAAASNDDDDDGTSTADINGTAIDGYIAGATAFYDANGNGILDEGESSTTTDNQGNFSLPGITETTDGQVVVLPGGTDVLTGAVINTPLIGEYTAGNIVVSPLTTLIANGADETELKEILGISQEVSLSTFDPVQAVFDGDPNGEAVFVASQQVMTALQAGVAAGIGNVEEVSANLATQLSATASLEAAITNTLGSEIGTAVNNINAVIESDMGNGGLLEAVETGTAEALNDALASTSVAQTNLITDIESGGDVSDVWFNTSSINNIVEAEEIIQGDSGLEFLIEQGIDLTGASFNLTDDALLTEILNDPEVDIGGANITLDDSLSEFEDDVAASTGTDVVVSDLGDY